jgi:hypothetical protein
MYVLLNNRLYEFNPPTNHINKTKISCLFRRLKKSVLHLNIHDRRVATRHLDLYEALSSQNIFINFSFLPISYCYLTRYMLEKDPMTSPYCLLMCTCCIKHSLAGNILGTVISKVIESNISWRWHDTSSVIESNGVGVGGFTYSEVEMNCWNSSYITSL